MTLVEMNQFIEAFKRIDRLVGCASFEIKIAFGRFDLHIDDVIRGFHTNYVVRRIGFRISNKIGPELIRLIEQKFNENMRNRAMVIPKRQLVRSFPSVLQSDKRDFSVVGGEAKSG